MAPYTLDSGIMLNVAQTYALGTAVGERDVGFVQLRTSARVSPAPISREVTVAGMPVSVFGFGCQDRADTTTGGFKQRIDYLMGSTSVSCPGDSGGPRFFGTNDVGAIWAVNSGFNRRTGEDLDGLAHVVRAREGLDGVRALGSSTENLVGVGGFASFSNTPGVRIVGGDFDGNGRVDLAAVGGQGMSAVAVAFHSQSGGFPLVTQSPVGYFAMWAQQARHILSGDFDGDGRDDLALLGGPGWSSVVLSLSQGNGAFTLAYRYLPLFSAWSAISGAQAVTGDFDGNGRDDIALGGVSGWTTTPIAFSSSSGQLVCYNDANPSFANLAATSGAQLLAGDFDGDGRDDIALTGSSGWLSDPRARSLGNGSFSFSNPSASLVGQWASTPGARAVVGDFDGDGRDDIALTGGAGWLGAGFGFSSGPGFRAGHRPFPGTSSFAPHAATVIAGPADADAQEDLLIPGFGWASALVVDLER